MAIELLSNPEEFQKATDAVQSGSIFIDIRKNWMCFFEVGDNATFYIAKLYDKSNNFTSLGTIDKCLGYIVDLINRCGFVIGYDLKHSIFNLPNYKSISSIKFYDIKVLLTLNSKFDILKQYETDYLQSDQDNFEAYTKAIYAFYRQARTTEILLASLKFPVIYKILTEAVIPYNSIEQQGILIKNKVDDDKLGQFNAFITSHKASIKGKIGKNAVLYPKFDLLGSITGRTSCNVHSMPRDIRCCFVARPRKKIIVFDYSAGEARVLVNLFGCKELETIFNNSKLDLHIINASLLFNKPMADITKEQREEAKAIFFATLNGATSAIDKEHVSSILKIYKSLFNKLDEEKSKIKQEQVVINPYGRCRILTEEFRESDWNGQIKGINTLLQSTLSDMKLEAINKIYNKYGSIILLEVHDSIVVEVDEDKVDEYKIGIIDIMKHPSIDLRCSIEISTTVGDTL